VKFGGQKKLVDLERDMFWYMKFLRGPIDDYWYETLFSEGRSHAYCADFSNTTSLLDGEGWNHLKNTVKSPKLIFTLRNPLDRLWSHLKFHAQWIGQSEDFSQFSLEEMDDFATKYNIFNDGRYMRTIGFLETFFDQSEYKLVFFENARRRPIAFLNGIEKFLGVEERDYSSVDFSKKVNPSQQLQKPTGFSSYFFPKLEEEYLGIKSRGLELPDSWKI
jgi:hypothetical protein